MGQVLPQRVVDTASSSQSSGPLGHHSQTWNLSSRVWIWGLGLFQLRAFFDSLIICVILADLNDILWTSGLRGGRELADPTCFCVLLAGQGN